MGKSGNFNNLNLPPDCPLQLPGQGVKGGGAGEHISHGQQNILICNNGRYRQGEDKQEDKSGSAHEDYWSLKPQMHKHGKGK